MTRVQKNLVTALTMLALGGGALVYTLAFDVKPAEERHQVERDAKRLFNIGLVDVRGGTLFSRGATLTFERAERGWTILEPVQWPANEEALRAMIARTTAIQIEKTLVEDATTEDLKTHGLNKPVARVLLDSKVGPLELVVGPKNKMIEQHPVTDGDRKRIGLVDASFFWALDRGVEDFREKRPFPFPPDSVKKLRLTKEDEPGYVLEKAEDGEQWLVSRDGESPVPADARSVRVLLARIVKQTTVERFLDDDYDLEDETKRKRYPLVEPELVIDIETESGKSRARFNRFRETAEIEGTPLLLIEGTKSVLVVSDAFEGLVERPWESLRDRTIAKYDRTEVQKVEFTVGKSTFTAEKSEGLWAIVAPEAHPAKTWTVDALVRGYSVLRSTRTHLRNPSAKKLRDWLLDPPARRVVFRDAAGAVLADIRFGSLATEEEVFVTAAGLDRVDVVSTDALTRFPASMKVLIDEEATP